MIRVRLQSEVPSSAFHQRPLSVTANRSDVLHDVIFSDSDAGAPTHCFDSKFPFATNCTELCAMMCRMEAAKMGGVPPTVTWPKKITSAR